jgi:hypothetical protein
MQTTLRIDDAIYREAKAQAARSGVTLTRFIEDALSRQLRQTARAKSSKRRRNVAQEAEIAERNRLMEELLQRTARFRIGRKPSRKEMNAR